MCLVCRDWEREKMTSEEALNALGEMIVSNDGNQAHYFAVADKILDKEVPAKENDPEIDGAWESKHRK